MKDRVEKSIQESIETNGLLMHQAGEIVKMAELAIECLGKGGKILLFGNGGSAADAQHIAAEFVGRSLRERTPLPVIALTTNTSSITAIGNDYGYEHVFERQVESLCTESDLVVGMSTSGNSKNVLLGIQAAKSKGARTIGLTGRSGGELSKMVDFALRVPSNSTPRIQECHILIGHAVGELVEEYFSNRVI
jgi:D-sedoheptulose 7-phosphate isomerase